MGHVWGNLLTCLGHVLDLFGTCSGCVLDMFWTSFGHALDKLCAEFGTSFGQYLAHIPDRLLLPKCCLIISVNCNAQEIAEVELR